METSFFCPMGTKKEAHFREPLYFQLKCCSNYFAETAGVVS